MVAEKYLRAGIVVGASLAILSSASVPSFAQSRMQTPRGDQTVAPSQMPQQPSLNEDFANPSKINQKVQPPVTGPDMPGIPGVEGPGRKPVTGPGMIQNGNGEMNGPLNMKQQPAGANGQPTAETPRTGGMVLPQGIPSSVRIGPVEPVPMWQRAALAFWMTINLVVLLMVAVGMTLMKKRDVDEYGGHIIHPDTTDPSFGGPTGTGVMYKG
jgi:hypothetical protein